MPEPGYHVYSMNSAPESKPSPRRSRLVYWLIALAIAAVLLYFSLRGIEWGEVWRILSHADCALVAFGFGISTFALLLRSLRWRVLLRSRAPVDIPTAFWATSAGYFGNNFLPARAGELVRTLLVSARSGLTKTFVLTTALSERLADAIALVIISSIVLLTLSVRPGWFDRAAKPFAIIGLCGVFAIAVLPKLEGLFRSLVMRLPVPPGIREKLLRVLEQILIGIRTFHNLGRLSRFIALTVLIWFSDAVGTIIGMHALGLSASLSVAFLLIAGLGLGSALPATPGYVGIYQFVAVSVLTPFGFSRSDAIAYIILAQAIQYVLITFWGLIGLARSRGVNFRAVGAEANRA